MVHFYCEIIMHPLKEMNAYWGDRIKPFACFNSVTSERISVIFVLTVTVTRKVVQ
jgi:hypothetical protein